MDPILADMEQIPMPTFLTTVGKSSEVTAYTTQNAAVMPNFPTISKKIANSGRSEKTAFSIDT